MVGLGTGTGELWSSFRRPGSIFAEMQLTPVVTLLPSTEETGDADRPRSYRMLGAQKRAA